MQLGVHREHQLVLHYLQTHQCLHFLQHPGSRTYRNSNGAAQCDPCIVDGKCQPADAEEAIMSLQLIPMPGCVDYFSTLYN